MSKVTKIALLDYGMGNLHSASKALSVVGAEVSITNDPKVVAAADKNVFHGVGAMRECIAGMHEAGIDEVIRHEVFNKPVMAICVGMQALFEQSAENGGTPCLAILDGDVSAFDPAWKDAKGAQIKVPHMGWNTISGMDLITHYGMVSRTTPIFTLYTAIIVSLLTAQKWLRYVIMVSLFVPV